MIVISLLFFIICVFASAVFHFRKKAENQKLRKYSILIACRNEESNILELIDNLNMIDYPVEMFEVIIVDDASEDDTWELLQREAGDLENFKIFRLEEKSEEYKGKKAALKKAAENAEFDYLLFTDADCLLDKEIFEGYNQVINDDTDAVVGWYQTQDSGYLQKTIDISSAIVFALSIYFRKPFSASGMNWLVKKDSFEAVKGYDRIKGIIAGDDKLLLNLIVENGGKVDFNPHNPVITKLEEEMNSQRLKRKYGKFSSSPAVHKTSVILLGLYLFLLVINVLLANIIPLYLYAAGMAVLYKFSCEHLRYKIELEGVISFLVFPFIAMYYTILGSVSNWEWKGQRK